jgi:hypothetical protein
VTRKAADQCLRDGRFCRHSRLGSGAGPQTEPPAPAQNRQFRSAPHAGGLDIGGDKGIDRDRYVERRRVATPGRNRDGFRHAADCQRHVDGGELLECGGRCCTEPTTGHMYAAFTWVDRRSGNHPPVRNNHDYCQVLLNSCRQHENGSPRGRHSRGLSRRCNRVAA